MSGKKKRGLSIDDKKKVILSIYHDRKEPFNLKEIESIASKMGVVQQTVKDVNQSLIDDSLILSDKIGSANFFWSFPSKLKQDRKSTERPNKLRRLNELIERERELDLIIESNKMLDPVEIKKIENQIAINLNAANRWTDNIYTLKRYLTKKKGMSSKEVDKMLQIDGKFDYIADDDKSSKG
eukprot:gene20876-27062_t